MVQKFKFCLYSFDCVFSLKHYQICFLIIREPRDHRCNRMHRHELNRTAFFFAGTRHDSCHRAVFLVYNSYVPRIGNGLVMIVSVVGGSSRWVSGDMTLVHIFNSCLLSVPRTPPRKRSDGEPFWTSICARYRHMTGEESV